MKKRLCAFLLALLTVLPLALPAAADMIWEPEDAFYSRHREQCTYVNRQYTLAGYDGTVQLWSAPDGMVQQTLDNGQPVTVSFVWQGQAVQWGYISGVDGDWNKGGWVPMDDLALVYDSAQFFIDHEDDIVEVDHVETQFTQALLYRYPGGPTAGGVLKEDANYLPFSQAFNTLYTDADGLRWAYVGYYMGHRQYWICLDDPMNSELDTTVVEADASPAQQRGRPTVEPNLVQRLPWALAAALVGAVVALTLLLIRKLCPRKQ